MIVSHHAGGLIGHVTAGPGLSYKWRDMQLQSPGSSHVRTSPYGRS